MPSWISSSSKSWNMLLLKEAELWSFGRFFSSLVWTAVFVLYENKQISGCLIMCFLYSIHLINTAGDWCSPQGWRPRAAVRNVMLDCTAERVYIMSCNHYYRRRGGKGATQLCCNDFCWDERCSTQWGKHFAWWKRRFPAQMQQLIHLLLVFYWTASPFSLLTYFREGHIWFWENDQGPAALTVTFIKCKSNIWMLLLNYFFLWFLLKFSH